MKSPLLIIDGSNFLFRAYHALPPLTNRQGQPTGAIRGVIVMLRKLLDTFNPEYVAVTFDAKGQSFRNKLYAEYKAHRPPMPDDLRPQIEPLQEIIKLLGLKLIIIDDIEADDVIATLAIRGKAENLPVIIASSDKDLAQLVGDNISLYDGMKNQHLGREEIFEKYGVYPELIRDYLALMGDKADNIPGIDGVGPKTAAKWLNEYGSLDALIANADKITGKIGEKLRAGIEILPLSKQLTTLFLEAPLAFELQDLKPQVPEIQRLREIYEHLEFRQLLTQLDQWTSTASNSEQSNTDVSASHNVLSSVKNMQVSSFSQKVQPLSNPPQLSKSANYQMVTCPIALQNLIEQMHEAAFIAIDTETDGLDYMQANLVGISLAIASGYAYYIPLKHDLHFEHADQQLKQTLVLNTLKPILESENYLKIGQNIKFDWHIFKRLDIELKGIVHDTMLMSYILNPTAFVHNMDFLAQKYLNYKTTSFEELAGKGVKQLKFNQIDLNTAAQYAAEDADITLQLYRAMNPLLQENSALTQVYNDIEIPLVSILAQMEHYGICIDVELLNTLTEEFSATLQDLEQQAYKLAGEEFNLASNKQLSEILFEKQQIPVVKKTPTGKPSTDESVLSALALDYPLPKLIINYRSLAKLISTYTQALVAQINPNTKRIHTSYQQAITSTGRLSSSEPNLQNIPIKTPEGRRIRQAFIAPAGYKLVAADYSQIELRLMAHLSEDPTLLQSFKDGEDIHRMTASEVFASPLLSVTNEQRRAAKAINFGLIYGMGAFGLAKQLGISRNQAQEYIALYFSRYPLVLAYMEAAKAKAHEFGYVETIFGRRLYLPEIMSPLASKRASAERLAINAPLQGSAADIIKKAMFHVQSALNNSKLDVKMLLQVHDELVFEVKEEDIDAFKILLREQMAKSFSLKVPLEIEIGVGSNWDEAH